MMPLPQNPPIRVVIGDRHRICAAPVLRENRQHVCAAAPAEGEGSMHVERNQKPRRAFATVHPVIYCAIQADRFEIFSLVFLSLSLSLFQVDAIFRDPTLLFEQVPFNFQVLP